MESDDNDGYPSAVAKENEAEAKAASSSSPTPSWVCEVLSAAKKNPMATGQQMSMGKAGPPPSKASTPPSKASTPPSKDKASTPPSKKAKLDNSDNGDNDTPGSGQKKAHIIFMVDSFLIVSILFSMLNI